MDHTARLAVDEKRCDDCARIDGHWHCTMNCSGAEIASSICYGEPEIVEMRVAEDGYPRWHIATREGWQLAGQADGGTLMLKASHFAVGTKITLREPLPNAGKS